MIPTQNDIDDLRQAAQFEMAYQAPVYGGTAVVEVRADYLLALLEAYETYELNEAPSRQDHEDALREIETLQDEVTELTSEVSRLNDIAYPGSNS